MNSSEGRASAEKLVYHPIGYIRSEHTEPQKTPIQPVYTEGCPGQVELLSEYEEGLKDLENFSHIYLIYHFHKVGPSQLTVKPFLEDVSHGVFATRATRRPNPIGFSLVRLVKREGNVLWIEDVDILDGTPLLDIKPFIPRFDYREGAQAGWQDNISEDVAQIRGRRDANNGEVDS